jgi:hypothetical protein
MSALSRRVPEQEATSLTANQISPEMLMLGDLHQQAAEAIEQLIAGETATIQDIYPLSPLQEGILFHHTLNEHSDSYVLSTVFEVRSRSHLDALIGGLQAVINRHDVLRTAILWEKLERPVQVVYRQAALPVYEIVLDDGLEPLEQLEERMCQGMDLRQAPLMRLHIAASTRDDRWYALLQRHHIVFDHQSWNLVFAEVIACAQGRERELPAPRSYRDYVEWALTKSAAHDAEAFFRNRLQDWEQPSTPFGLEDVRAAGNQIREARRELHPALAELVRRQAKQLGVSAARLFHAAWALVVARTSGQEDVVFGTVLSGSQRQMPAIHGMPGMFVNTLPLRLSLRDVTAAELVEQTHRELKELVKHQQASLTLVQRCSGSGTSPLFTAVLNYRHSAGHSVVDPRSDSGSAGFRMLAQRYRTSYPVALVVDDLGDEFTLTAQTDQRIDPNRVVGYAEAAVRALAQALERNPQTRLCDLSIMPADERRCVVEEFNATEEHYGQGRLIHELFEEQARRSPEAVAAVYEGRSLTYGELDARSNRLARLLRQRGIGPDRLVAICVERSLEMVVGLLGILKAGGAYLPLDPSYPSERLQYMLQDAAPGVVLVQRATRERLPASPAAMIELDAQWNDAEDDERSLTPDELGLKPSNLLYVIYTSGSTGRPKGTAMAHEAMVNLMEWHRRHLPLREGERVLQFAALSFDVAFQDIFSTLCGKAFKGNMKLELDATMEA